MPMMNDDVILDPPFDGEWTECKNTSDCYPTFIRTDGEGFCYYRDGSWERGKPEDK